MGDRAHLRRQGDMRELEALRRDRIMRLPLGWPVKRINVIGIMLPQRQHEMRVSLGDGVHVVRRRSRASTRH
jgi:hypothetical protein